MKVDQNIEGIIPETCKVRSPVLEIHIQEVCLPVQHHQLSENYLCQALSKWISHIRFHSKSRDKTLIKDKTLITLRNRGCILRCVKIWGAIGHLFSSPIHNIFINWIMQNKAIHIPVSCITVIKRKRCWIKMLLGQYYIIQYFIDRMLYFTPLDLRYMHQLPP